jgi:5-(carboxyamino)imidazole ribonucleotide synthase
MNRVGVVGGGQLARMMIPAAINLGVDISVFSESEDSSAALAATHVGDYRDEQQLATFADSVDVLTFDHEHVPMKVLESVRDTGVRVFPPPEALALTHNKIVMRRKLEEIGIPQPRWTVISKDSTDEGAVPSVGGFPCVAKSPIGGYDGKGVRVISAFDEVEDWLSSGEVLIEEKVDFVRELAQLGAIRPSGQWSSWPVVETRQVGGVCSEVLAPAPNVTDAKRSRAEEIAETIAREVGVVGVLAVELFETRDGEVIVNELAMRPHNSGHVFTELSITSQFEQHLRAVLDFPLGSSDLRAEAGVMINLFGGVDHELAKVASGEFPEAKIHSYQKSPRAGRKAGHVVLTGKNHEVLLRRGLAVRSVLDSADYDG